MSVAEFAITAEAVRASVFPHWSAFSSTTKPTATLVATYITEEAADLGGKLMLKGVAPSAITSGGTPYAYAWCQKTLKLMVGARVAKAATASNPELAKTLQEELERRFELLEAHGEALLVDVSSSTDDSPAEGPTTHISQYGLTVDDEADMSTTVPRLRRDDPL